MAGVKAETARLLEPIDLVRLGARTGMLWRGREATLAGLGTAVGSAAVAVDRPAETARLVESIEPGHAEVTGPGTGAVALVTLPFDRSATGTLIVPRIVLGQARDGRRWLTVVGDPPPDLDAAREEVDAALARPVPAGPHPTDYRLRSPIAPETWRERVAGTVDRIRAGSFDKAVLARELELVTDHPVDPALVIDRLADTFGSANLFAVDGFVGASPEILVARIDGIVSAHPLAGTAPRSDDPVRDQRAITRLLASDKDRWEHQITIDWLLDRLLPFCSYVDAEPEPTIITLPNVHHLGSRVEGVLDALRAGVLELVDVLHPTPAVGGHPQAAAIDHIGAVEGIDRGRYAGPTGWVDAASNGEFAVSVRSAQLDGTTARLWAGAGIVEGSDPAAELAETRAKFQAVLGALVRP